MIRDETMITDNGGNQKQPESGSPTYSEVWRCQRVCGVAVLTDDGGGVSPLTAVVTSAPYAGHFADGGCEDHLDPSCLVPQRC